MIEIAGESIISFSFSSHYLEIFNIHGLIEHMLPCCDYGDTLEEFKEQLEINGFKKQHSRKRCRKKTGSGLRGF